MLRQVYLFLKTMVSMTLLIMVTLYAISAVYMLIDGEFKGPATYPEFIRCLEMALWYGIVFACAEAFFSWVRYLKQKELEEEANSKS
ncbi:hypothetical protein CWE22_07315 [Pseudidiomarina aestuarii]|uniref:Uncharacterized protein n=2 Tax=Pseudidiomarina aestuarii TaxID=624146 RepID=A0A7Z7EUA7_9GAMM|nr:hypothetical protein CWE22_07315 [Pseudidiomarina aestuarii]